MILRWPFLLLPGVLLLTPVLAERLRAVAMAYLHDRQRRGES